MSMTLKRELISEHIPYEYSMMHNSFQFAVSIDLKKPDPKSVICNNMIFECFWLHARNLIEFFQKDYPEDARVACAGWFTTRHLHYEFDDKLVDLVNEQVTHLSPFRGSYANPKLSGYQIYLIKSGIDRAFLFFQNNLKAEFATDWKKIRIDAPTYNAEFWPTTSNHVTSTALTILPDHGA